MPYGAGQQFVLEHSDLFQAYTENAVITSVAIKANNGHAIPAVGLIEI